MAKLFEGPITSGKGTLLKKRPPATPEPSSFFDAARQAVGSAPAAPKKPGGLLGAGGSVASIPKPSVGTQGPTVGAKPTPALPGVPIQPPGGGFQNAPGGGFQKAPPGSIITRTADTILPETFSPQQVPGSRTDPYNEGTVNGQPGPLSGPAPVVAPQPTAPAQPPTPAAPAATPPGATPPVTGPGIQGFSAEDNLIGTQINPQDNPRLQGVQAQLDQALQGLQGPDRGQIARDLYKGIEQDTADERTRGIRQISEAAGRLGRIGAGGVSTDLGSLEERLSMNRDRQLRELSAGAAGESLSDQLKKLGGTADIEQLLSGIGAQKRGEVRGERDYQRDLSQDPIRQRLLEEQLQQGAFDRYLRQGALLTGASGS
jgi:hypothetical protein